MNSLSNRTKTLKEYLSSYTATFDKDIDVMWNEFDVDKNGYLDREEARGFVQ